MVYCMTAVNIDDILRNGIVKDFELLWYINNINHNQILINNLIKYISINTFIYTIICFNICNLFNHPDGAEGPQCCHIWPGLFKQVIRFLTACDWLTSSICIQIQEYLMQKCILKDEKNIIFASGEKNDIIDKT